MIFYLQIDGSKALVEVTSASFPPPAKSLVKYEGMELRIVAHRHEFHNNRSHRLVLEAISCDEREEW